MRHVVQNGFGAYSRDPNVIAETVWGWFKDPAKLARMSEQARKHSRPQATGQIAADIVQLLEESCEHLPPASASERASRMALSA